MERFEVSLEKFNGGYTNMKSVTSLKEQECAIRVETAICCISHIIPIWIFVIQIKIFAIFEQIMCFIEKLNIDSS